jgi:hypothetical protein
MTYDRGTIWQIVPYTQLQSALVLQREIDHLGFLLFRFSDFSVRLRWEQ